MRVLVVHNFYQQPGGEDAVFKAEKALLSCRNNELLEFVRHNDELNWIGRVNAAVLTIWSRDSKQALRRIIHESCPDVAHFHNTFLLISPAAYYACKEAGVPVVQTLHNYRLLCPAATFLRDGSICEDCLGKMAPWPGLLHGCWRGSRAQTAVVGTMLKAHKWLKTWQRQVDVYIALTEFARRKFIAGGLPAEKIVVKPNFVDPDPRFDDGQGGYALFVGRLTQEKGIYTLLKAWEMISSKISIKIVGDGPLASQVEELSRRISGIEWLGHKPRQFVMDLMKNAKALIFPSIWYEGFPMAIVEAYSVGLPVIASNLGSMASLIDHGRTGLHFQPGDPNDLAKQMDWIVSHPAELQRMRQEVIAEYEFKYTAEINYKMLMDIYKTAIERSKKKPANQLVSNKY